MKREGIKLPPGPARNLKWHMRVRLMAWPDVEHVKREMAEFSALLAVARAAKRVAREKLQPRPPFTTLDRALARLDRVSKAKP